MTTDSRTATALAAENSTAVIEMDFPTSCSGTACRFSHLELREGIKIKPVHRDRLAVVYVRQSSPQQVLDHRESRELQYKLARRAAELGWSKDRVLVIDQDQAHTATSAEDRLGFQQLLAEVSLNHVGMVLGIEMSRLARSNKDWHQLLELCALFNTLLYDPDGCYDPGNYNDRLLLGLKGAMSEAEIHILRARMEQGRRNKAERGEWFTKIACGYIQLPSGEVAHDADEQVQAVIRIMFDKFEELGSAHAVLRYLVRNGIRIPYRIDSGANRGQLDWRAPRSSRLLKILHNPIYAGAYVFGRTRMDFKRGKSGKRGQKLVPRGEWGVVIPNRLPAYIDWQQFLRNQQKLSENWTRGGERGAPREGHSLLAGLIECGRCGYRMQVSYNGRSPYYQCQGERNGAGHVCQSVSGVAIEETVARQSLSVLEPASLELSLRAANDVQRERQVVHQHWHQRLERASFEISKAKRQYDAVEPENRLVARELERRWEAALLQHRQLEEEHDRFLNDQPRELSDRERDAIMSLASDLPTLWHAPATGPADRQTIIRHLIDRVVVSTQGESEYVDLTIHWKGGFVSQQEVIRTVSKYSQLRDFLTIKRRIVELHAAGTAVAEIAKQLNQDGFHAPRRKQHYTTGMIHQFLARYRLKSPKRAPHRDKLLTHEWWVTDLARELLVARPTLQRWRRKGWLHAREIDGWWAMWADESELQRLRRIRDQVSLGHNAYPSDITTPKQRHTH